MTGPDFKAISASGKIDLTSISVGGEAYVPGECGGVVFIQVLKYNGSTDATYEWRDITGDFDPGWYNDQDEKVEADAVTFDLGDGLWVQGDDGYQLIYNGEVFANTQLPVPLRFGNTAVSNPYPVAIDLTTISVGGDAYVEGECGGVVFIQVLKYNGSADATYEWRDITGDFDPGWYNDQDEMVDPETVYFDPAQGLWVQGEDGYDLQFPALILK